MLCLYPLFKKCKHRKRTESYDLVRHSETKKHKKASEPLNSINMVQPQVSFTLAKAPVENKCQAALSL